MRTRCTPLVLISSALDTSVQFLPEKCSRHLPHQAEHAGEQIPHSRPDGTGNPLHTAPNPGTESVDEMENRMSENQPENDGEKNVEQYLEDSSKVWTEAEKNVYTQERDGGKQELPFPRHYLSLIHI